MPSSSITRIPDPLSDRFALSELPAIAPWVAERIELLGPDAVGEALVADGADINEPQRMDTWVSALTRLNGPLWEALDVA
jgi:hypothetical protein